MTSSGMEVYTQRSAKEQKQGSTCRKADDGYNREGQCLSKHANQLQDGGPHLQGIPTKLVTQKHSQSLECLKTQILLSKEVTKLNTEGWAGLWREQATSYKQVLHHTQPEMVCSLKASMNSTTNSLQHWTSRLCFHLFYRFRWVSNSSLTSFRGIYFSRKVFTSFKSMLSEVSLKISCLPAPGQRCEPYFWISCIFSDFLWLVSLDLPIFYS